ncbi:hypothetical protein IWX90DRAFT_40227 [Phyllosticta citrichinensis]|uniref:Uncharacterized protein n=1 Tax=Phyllosticta citrichinensis TaxID=1130410 RepID=A0ABR1Y8Q2_9PEZI
MSSPWCRVSPAPSTANWRCRLGDQRGSTHGPHPAVRHRFQALQFLTLYAVRWGGRGTQLCTRVVGPQEQRMCGRIEKKEGSEADDQPGVGCCIVRPFEHWPRVRLVQMGLFLQKPVDGKCSPGRSLQVQDKWESCFVFVADCVMMVLWRKTVKVVFTTEMVPVSANIVLPTLRVPNGAEPASTWLNVPWKDMSSTRIEHRAH